MRLFGLTQRQDTAAREKKAREPREGKQQPGRCSPGKQGWGTRQDAPARTGKQDRAPQRQDTTPGSQTRYRHNLKDTRTNEGVDARRIQMQDDAKQTVGNGEDSDSDSGSALNSERVSGI
ncbi:hypothetical protein CCHR01_04900 [Colletotrichum chrysophilum]|uniref:Uncharacterized protein n=1 Tax=Colletotrichum chrysophilum TaxID=1836956 RepID=A0AAD9AS65_9PEZI|nr:hypothetical protein CCHR01_04900 [Colletotrichum chrysophilum]